MALLFMTVLGFDGVSGTVTFRYGTIFISVGDWLWRIGRSAWEHSGILSIVWIGRRWDWHSRKWLRNIDTHWTRAFGSLQFSDTFYPTLFRVMWAWESVQYRQLQYPIFLSGVAGAIMYAVFERKYGVLKTGMVGMIVSLKTKFDLWSFLSDSTNLSRPRCYLNLAARITLESIIVLRHTYVSSLIFALGNEMWSKITSRIHY